MGEEGFLGRAKEEVAGQSQTSADHHGRQVEQVSRGGQRDSQGVPSTLECGSSHGLARGC